MSRSTCRIEIQRPVEDVFSWLDDDEKALQWLGGLEEIVPMYTLTPQGNATLLDLTSETRFKSGPMRLLAPLLAGVSKRRVMTDLQKLKSLVENA